MDGYVTTTLSLGGTVLTGILIAATSSWITVRLSLKRFQTERMWERKVDNYQQIIELLHDSRILFDEQLEAELNGFSLKDERRDELIDRLILARDRLPKQIDVSSLFLSDDARNRLLKLLNEARDIDRNVSSIPLNEQFIATYNQCLNDFIEIAKTDLKIKSR